MSTRRLHLGHSTEVRSNLLIDHTGGIFMCDGFALAAVKDPYFCVGAPNSAQFRWGGA